MRPNWLKVFRKPENINSEDLSTAVNLKDIEKIMKLMDDHGLSQLKFEQDETKLELKKGGDIDVEAVSRLIASNQQPMMAQQQPMLPVANPGPTPSNPAPATADGPPPGHQEITSPMVGTFYTSEKPDSPPFVKPGDQVTADTTVCIIEAMKVFNEIKAESQGEIVEILVENGTPVQFGEPLFLIKL